MREGHAITHNEILKFSQSAKTLSRVGVNRDMKEGKGRPGAGETAQKLRALAAFQGIQVQFQVPRLTNIRNSSSKGSDAFF